MSPAHAIFTKVYPEKPTQHVQTEEALRQAQGERRLKCVRVDGNARTLLGDGDLLWDSETSLLEALGIKELVVVVQGVGET